MKKPALTLLLMFVSCTSVAATPPALPETMWMTGRGMNTCADALAEMERLKNYETIYAEWTLGFFTGINHAAWEAKTFALAGQGYTNTALFEAVKAKCRQDPLLRVLEAAVLVYRDLRSRPRSP